MNQETSGLANWIGHLISGWPLWTVIVVIALVGLCGVVAATFGDLSRWPASLVRWWDRKRGARRSRRMAATTPSVRERSNDQHKERR